MVVSFDLSELMRFYVEKYSERNISSEKELADFLQAFLASDAQIYLIDLQRQVEAVVYNAIGILDLYFQNARKTNEAMAALSAYSCLIYICDKYMKEKENSNA